MAAHWDDPEQGTETLESRAGRPGGGRLLVVLALVAGLLAGSAAMRWVQRRQSERDARSGIHLFGLFESAEAPVADGRSDVSAGLRVFNAGPFPVTVSALRLTGAGLATGAAQSRAPVRVSPGSASLALALRSDCTGPYGPPLSVTASVRTADGRSRRTHVPLDPYSDGYLALNAACTEARLQAAAPLPDIDVRVESARVLRSGARAVLHWQLALTGDPGITVSRLALGGRRLRLSPQGLPVTFGTTRTALLRAEVRAAPCTAGLQPADFLLTWTASRGGRGGVQQRLANISGVPPDIVLRTARYAAQVCGTAGRNGVTPIH